MNNNNLTRENLNSYLKAFIKKEKVEIDSIAKSISCSIYSLNRIIRQITYPSDKMIKQCGIMFAIGFENYKKLSDADKEKVSEKLGVSVSGTLGFVSISQVISSLGIAGLSAKGISTGLAALGALVGGGMAIGVTVAAAIPVALAGVGYGIVKIFKGINSSNNLHKKNFDPIWELKK